MSSSTSGRGPVPPEVCWLARFDPDGRPCDGPPDRAHLIPKSLIRRRLREGGITDLKAQGGVVWSRAVWVCACRYHHGQLDVSKRLRVPRGAIPQETEAYAAILGLTGWLDREYGRRDADSLPRPSESDDDEDGLGGGAGPAGP